MEIKRRREIGPGIVDEIARKVECLPIPRDVSARTALVYDGELSPSVEACGWFDHLVPAARLFETRPFGGTIEPDKDWFDMDGFPVKVVASPRAQNRAFAGGGGVV